MKIPSKENSLPRRFRVQDNWLEFVVFDDEVFAFGVAEDHAGKDGAVGEIRFHVGWGPDFVTDVEVVIGVFDLDAFKEDAE